MVRKLAVAAGNTAIPGLHLSRGAGQIFAEVQQATVKPGVQGVFSLPASSTVTLSSEKDSRQMDTVPNMSWWSSLRGFQETLP